MMTENIYNEWIVKDQKVLDNYTQDKKKFVIAVKDCIETKDFHTTGGTKSLQNYNGLRDAEVIVNLRNAGVEIAGKTNLHELCFGTTCNNAHTGVVKNPHNTEYVSGGSSGGSAVAIATNQVRAGVGTDTGGSSRIPAAFCGIYGFRPSSGRYKTNGIIPISYTFDTAGPMANNLEDICYMDCIMAGKSNAYDGATKPESSNIRLGVPNVESLGLMDDTIADLYKKSLEKLKSAGVTLVEVSLVEVQELEVQVAFPVVFYDVIRDLPHWLNDSNCEVTLDDLIAQTASPDVAGALQMAVGEGATPEDLYDDCINIIIPKMKSIYKAILKDNNLNAIVWPTVPVLAPKIGEDETINVSGETVPTFQTTIRNTIIASVLGVPSVSIPMGVGSNNLPAGLMLDGVAKGDEELLLLASTVDSIIR